MQAKLLQHKNQLNTDQFQAKVYGVSALFYFAFIVAQQGIGWSAVPALSGFGNAISVASFLPV